MSMTLYGAPLSPYVSKLLILAEAKGLDLPMTVPPGGVGSDEYKTINPTGKVPALDVDGTVVPESLAIAIYLNSTQDGPSVLGETPLETAKILSVAQVAELYIGDNMGALFGQMNPETRSEDITKARLDGMKTGIARLDAMIQPGPFAVGDTLSLADCTIAPFLFYATQLFGVFGLAKPLEGTKNLETYWNAIRADERVAPVLAKMGEALAAMQRGS